MTRIFIRIHFVRYNYYYRVLVNRRSPSSITWPPPSVPPGWTWTPTSGPATISRLPPLVPVVGRPKSRSRCSPDIQRRPYPVSRLPRILVNSGPYQNGRRAIRSARTARPHSVRSNSLLWSRPTTFRIQCPDLRTNNNKIL